MSEIGIIMATYNGELYIREQIDSILTNTYEDWKLIICDDGSLDNTISIVEEYTRKYPEKIYLHENAKNMGVMFNFLHGIKRSDSSYIMFCDQDDVWKKDKIQVTYDKMKCIEQNENKNIPIAVFSDALVVDSTLNIIHSSFHKVGVLNVEKLDLSHILMENKLLGCTVMINKIVKEMLTTLPTTARMHDWWIALLCASFGTIGVIKEPTILYRQHDNNVIGGNQSFMQYVKNRLSTIEKQKTALSLTQVQAQNFYQIYKSQLSLKNKDIIYQFSSLQKRNWLYRRFIVIKYRFLKTGIIRNIGILILI